MKSPHKLLEEFGSAFDVCLDVDDEMVEFFNLERSKADSGQGETSEQGHASDNPARHDATEQHG